MNDQLCLHVPIVSELVYRQRLLADPESMEYNKGYDISCDGYHPDTGCIDFSPEEWERWHRRWALGKPRRFYAYIARKEDGAFIGDVCLHEDAPGEYGMGIVIQAKYRGMGYGAPALWLLLQAAFGECGATAVHNEFEDTRVAAKRIHLATGFRETRGRICRLRITKEEYEVNRQ